MVSHALPCVIPPRTPASGGLTWQIFGGPLRRIRGDAPEDSIHAGKSPRMGSRSCSTAHIPSGLRSMSAGVLPLSSGSTSCIYAASQPFGSKSFSFSRSSLSSYRRLSVAATGRKPMTRCAATSGSDSRMSSLGRNVVGDAPITPITVDAACPVALAMTSIMKVGPHAAHLALVCGAELACIRIVSLR